jgi:hypothetical protein
MGVRFRRRITIMPGVRINLSKSGASLSVGPRGASMTLGRNGVYANAGLPGTGLYSRERVWGGATRSQRRGPSSSPDSTTRSATVRLQEDGTVVFLDPDTQAPVEPRVEKLMKEQNGDNLRAWLDEHCADINEQVEAVAQIHLGTPDPSVPPRFKRQSFKEEPPVEPVPKRLPMLMRACQGLFPRPGERLAAENEQRAAEYRDLLADYERRRARFEDGQRAEKRLIEEEIYSNPERMADFLEARLGALDWPRETLVSDEVADGGALVRIDVDLPEIEDMPTQTAAAHTRGFRISKKEMSAAKVRQLYAGHVHGVLFRVIGETFHALPKADRVVASGYSQRPDPATGRERDDYLLSVDASRADWSQIEFSRLREVDPVGALQRFQLRRTMTKTGVFRPIEPW